jgi:hypothetical protein
MLPGPVAFRHAGIGFLGHPAPAGAAQPPSRLAYRACSDPIGVATLPAREIRPGWVLSILRGAVPTQPTQAFRLPLAASQRPTLYPGAASTTPGLG